MKPALPLLLLVAALSVCLGCPRIHLRDGGLPELETAPELSLPSQSGGTVTLAGLRAARPDGGGVLVVFYRGHW